jgi:hypothetical protein
MCGHFGGISTSLADKDLDNIYELGVISQLRGRDSTGIACVRKEKKDIYVDVFKSLSNSSEFLYDQQIIKEIFPKEDRPICIMGHCRAATIGDVNPDNAHPFDLDTIIGAHNGTIDKMDKKPGGTDSEALYEILKADGVQAAVDIATEKDGAYALVWIDSDDQTLNMLRNAKRQLWYMTYAGVLYWCSDYYMMLLMAKRAGASKPEIFLLDEDKQLKVFLQHPLWGEKWIDRKPTRKPFSKLFDKDDKIGPQAKEAIAAGDACPFVPDKPKPSVPITKVRSEKASTSGEPLSANVMIKGFQNKLMTPEVAAHKYREGCSFCAHEPRIGDTVHFFNKKEFLCDGCRKNPERKYYASSLITFPGGSNARH